MDAAAGNATAAGALRRAAPDGTIQAQNLDALAAEIGRTAVVFQEAGKSQDSSMAEQMEETVRKLKKERAYMGQKAKHIMDTSKSYSARFEHEIAGSDEALSKELNNAVTKMEEAIAAADERMGEAEAALQEQHRLRLEHAEKNLGPLRDQAAALTKALDAERRARRLQEERREKLLADEVEAVNRLMDEEKFSREQQLMEFAHWANAEQQHAAKRQYHIEKETRDLVSEIRHDHQAMARDRVESQHRIIESIGAFVSRYRGHMSKEVQQALADLDLTSKVARDGDSDADEN